MVLVQNRQNDIGLDRKATMQESVMGQDGQTGASIRSCMGYLGVGYYKKGEGPLYLALRTPLYW